MHLNPLINKKTVRSNAFMKNAQKLEEKKNGKGSRKPLKNYIGKIVCLESSELIGQESGIPDFIYKVSKDNLLAAIENANLTGMSGNGFPVHKKINAFLSSGSGKKILLINAVECDPALLHDEWLLKNRFNEIAQTIDLLAKTFSLDKAVLAVKSESVESCGNFSVCVVPPRYPMGEEHFLIRRVLGIPLEIKNIPAEHGVLVLNIQSIYQIGKIANQCYDGGRFITIADLIKASARVAYVYPNDTVSCVLSRGFSESKADSVYFGHGAMACVKSTSADTFSKYGNFAAYANEPKMNSASKCRRCGNCTRKCPVNIKAAKIVQLTDKNKPFDSTSFDIDKCVKCGSCTYFCPALKNVSGYIAELLYG
ncbi:MAG: 4Fe-4S dicluster domain-containing protein [Oscillospiraceae bacterium]|nr:4Fe-4S dicluster domain-containing protein [Oscillospiraceae bacterium]